MGTISQKLQNRLSKAKAARSLQAQITTLPTRGELEMDALNPLHAAYIRVQHLTSVFSETVSQFKELDEFVKIISEAEDQYMPGGPPMSPLTMSYFTTWAFFDVRFGPDQETIGTCLADVADLLKLDGVETETLRSFQQTRMGIYEHCGGTKSKVRLRELITGEESACECPSGYPGKKGQLWYVRICPPLTDLGQSSTVITTPYILGNTTVADWTAYFSRNIPASTDQVFALHEFLKFGPVPFYWHEFVFLGYHHHQHDAIFLAGIPDVKSSLPQTD